MKLTKTITILSIVGLVLVVSACVKKPAINNNVTLSNVDGSQNTNTSTTTEEIDISNWKTYRNEELGVEFKYPEDWPYSERNLTTIPEEKGQPTMVLNLPDLSFIEHTFIAYDNIPIEEQYKKIKCDNGSIKCEEKISKYGAKYIWFVSKDLADNFEYGAYIPTGKYILIFSFGEKENYNKRASQYENLLITLKIIN
jgi:hypothetical protein